MRDTDFQDKILEATDQPTLTRIILQPQQKPILEQQIRKASKIANSIEIRIHDEAVMQSYDFGWVIIPKYDLVGIDAICEPRMMPDDFPEIEVIVEDTKLLEELSAIAKMEALAWGGQEGSEHQIFRIVRVTKLVEIVPSVMVPVEPMGRFWEFELEVECLNPNMWGSNMFDGEINEEILQKFRDGTLVFHGVDDDDE